MLLKTAIIVGNIAVAATSEASILAGLSDDGFILVGIERNHLEVIEGCKVGVHTTHQWRLKETLESTVIVGYTGTNIFTCEMILSTTGASVGGIVGNGMAGLGR